MTTTGTTTPVIAESIYEKLTNEEDARACRDIPDSACRESPVNFLLILTTQLLTKLGDALTSPKTVLAWLAGTVGAPAAVLGLLVPIRESGSLIPQLLIGGYVRRAAVRKWYWVIGSVLQGACVIGIGLVALTMQGAVAGWSLLGLLAIFSLSRGICSIASKDVLGKTIPKGRRGQLTGWSACAAGLISIGIGLVFLSPVVLTADRDVLALLLLGAGGIWFLAAAVYALVREEPGEIAGGENGVRNALSNVSLLVNDAPFRQFVLTRTLLMCSALSAPFYVSLAQQRQGNALCLLGAFVIAAGSADLLSSPLWGRFSDRSSKRVMFWAACITSAVGLSIAVLNRQFPDLLSGLYVIPLAYFFLSIAHSGVRVGRKTYVVDLSSGNRRTDYVSVSNSVIGIMLLLVGALGLLTESLGTDGMIGLLALMGAAGAIMTARLKEV